MKTMKILGWLGTITATGLVGAAGYALAVAPQAAGIRERLRTSYDELKSRLRGEMKTTPTEETATHEATQDAVSSEHAIEHGASGRERAADHGRKPHVAQPHLETASLHPFRAQRHG
jgi:hypothetical protein